VLPDDPGAEDDQRIDHMLEISYHFFPSFSTYFRTETMAGNNFIILERVL
jgi:hypothetical protein